MMMKKTLSMHSKLIMLYSIFWESGSPLSDLIAGFESDPESPSVCTQALAYDSLDKKKAQHPVGLF